MTSRSPTSRRRTARPARGQYVRALAALHQNLFETLEPRVLLSCVVTQTGNTLSIVGNRDSDFVQIVDLGAGNVSVACSPAPGPSQATTYKGVAHIKLDTGAGDDSVTCVGQSGGGGGGALFDVFADLAITTGAGADSVAIKYLQIKGDLAVTAGLGDGADSLQMDVAQDMSAVSAPVSSSALHRFTWKLDSGGGNDTARCSFFDVFCDASAAMGAGNDALTLKYKGELHLAADMGDGNDSFSSSADSGSSQGAVPLYASSLFMKYTGGAGNDDTSLTNLDVFTDISLDQGAGNDSLYSKMELSSGNKFAPPAGMVSDCRLYLFGGDGNDAASLISILPYATTARSCLAFVDQGAGNDSWSLDCSTSGTPSSTLQASSLFLKLDGGAGNDSTKMSFFDVFTELSCDTGSGNDNSYLKLDGIKGECGVAFALGAGDDTFDFNCNDSADHKGFVAPTGRSPDALFLKIEGGDGIDSISTACTDVFCDSSIDGGAGNDKVFQKVELSDKLAGDFPLDMQADCRLSVLGGDGSDNIQTSLLLPAVQRSRQASVSLDGGAGNDQFTCSASAATASLNFTKVQWRVSGGDGGDALSGSFFDVFTDCAFDGGAGNDAVVMKLDGIKGECVVSADMGAGNDLFDVTANNSSAHPGYSPPLPQALNFEKITFKYDGGAGNDACRTTVVDEDCDSSLDGGDGNDSFTVRHTLTDKFENGDIPDQQDLTLRLGGGLGNDNVLIGLLLPAVARGHSMSMDVDLGGGSDRFTCSASSVAIGKSSPILLRMAVSGGDGNDSSSMSFFDVFTECALNMGAGNDSSFLTFDGIKGECLVSADMGAGSDSFTASAASSALHQGYVPPVGASPDALLIKFDGADGNDACNVSTSDVFCAQSLDGGAGNDSFTIKHDYSDLEIGDRPTGSQFGSLIDSDIACDISGGAGADTVRYTIKMSALQADRVVDVSADMGDGSDVFTMDGTGDSAMATGKHLGKIEILCSAAAGNDSASCTFTDIFADNSLDMGAGNDAVSYKHAGVQGESSFACDLGAGSNTFSSTVSASSSSPPAGTVLAPSAMFMKLDAGAGNDLASMSFFDVFVDVSADMGGGNNRVAQKVEIHNTLAARPSSLASDVHSSITCGDGSDNVLVSHLRTGHDQSLDDSLDIDLGGGSDRLQLDATGVPDLTPAGALAMKIHMKLDLGAGSDTARCNLTDVFSDVSGTLGDGNDQLFLKYQGALDESRCAAEMGAGNDLLDVSATSSLSAAQNTPGSALVFSGDCDDGNDVVRMSFFDVFTEVACDLGAGNNSYTVKHWLSSDAVLPPDMSSASSFNVTGGDGNNAILIGLLLPAVQKAPISPAASVRVDLGNGNNAVRVTDDSSTPTSAASAGGLSCEIACGDGANVLAIQVGSQSNGASLPTFDAGSVSLTVACGAGGNTISLAKFINTTQGEVCDDVVSSGDGADNISISNTLGSCDGSVRVTVDSGAGADQILALATGDLNGDGALDIIVAGGAGDDSVAIRESPSKASLGKTSIRLEAAGGDGDDTLTVVCPDGSSPNGTPADSSLQALADGGAGYDVAYVSPTVVTIDVEETHPPL
jgi:hypothetical protein